MSFKNVIVDFTGFKLNKSKSTYNHIVYNKDDNYISIDYEDDESSCDIFKVYYLVTKLWEVYITSKENGT